MRGLCRCTARRTGPDRRADRRRPRCDRRRQLVRAPLPGVPHPVSTRALVPARGAAGPVRGARRRAGADLEVAGVLLLALRQRRGVQPTAFAVVSRTALLERSGPPLERPIPAALWDFDPPSFPAPGPESRRTAFAGLIGLLDRPAARPATLRQLARAHVRRYQALGELDSLEAARVVAARLLSLYPPSARRGRHPVPRSRCSITSAPATWSSSERPPRPIARRSTPIRPTRSPRAGSARRCRCSPTGTTIRCSATPASTRSGAPSRRRVGGPRRAARTTSAACCPHVRSTRAASKI